MLKLPVKYFDGAGKKEHIKFDDVKNNGDAMRTYVSNLKFDYRGD